MKGVRNTVWLFSLIVFSTTAWADQSLLNRCKRNGQRYLERAKKADAYARDKANHERIVETLRRQDIGDGKIQGITFDGQPQFEAWAKDCVTAGWSEKIKDLPGYSEVLKYYEETKAIYNTLDNKYIPELYKKSQSAAMDRGPGGDSKAQLARWDLRPKRCKADKPWQESKGKTSAVKGMDEVEGKTKLSPAEQTLAAVVCGKKILGIDPSPFRGGSVPDGIRATFVQALLDEGLGDDHRILYRALLAYACYHVEEEKLKPGEGWDLKKHYGTYAVCGQSIGKNPSPEAVEAAFERTYPGREYEKQNIVHITKLGLRKRAEIEGAFKKLGRKKPRLKKVFWDARLKGLKNWKKWRKKHASVFGILDPITAKLQGDPASTAPDDCLEKLLRLRAKLEKKIKPRNESDMRKLRIGNPLHYQLSEALTHCYISKGRVAKAFLESGVLAKGVRRVTKAEWAFLAIQDALLKAQRDLRSKEAIDRELPGWDWPYRLPTFPQYGVSGGKLRDISRARGRLKKIGESELEPAVLASMKKVSGGMLLHFRKVAWKYPQHKYECTTTDKVDHYEIQGNRLKPVYQRTCKKVGKPKWIKVSYQEKPQIVPAEDAALLKKGMFLEIVVNEGKKGDSAVTSAYLVKKKRFKGKQKILEGIRMW